MRTSGNFGFIGQDCFGQLSLGAAAISYSDWNGDLRGLAIFNSSLTEAQVTQHYVAWNTEGQLKSTQADNLGTLFTFGERQGSAVHNDIVGKPDLHIPPTFQIPGRPFLDNPWNEFRSIGVGWKDVLVNITGFVPFGFFLYSFLSSTRQNGPVALATIVIGAFVSLTIEVLQWYLPTRDSSMTDIITNTTGTAMGVAVYRFLFGTLQIPKS